MTFVGIDNGVSGSMGILGDGICSYKPMPVFRCLDYTKVKKFINRVEFENLVSILRPFAKDSFCFVERPMVNGLRFKASLSAIRAFESTLIALDQCNIGHEVVDSKKWQRELLPSGLWKTAYDKNGKAYLKAEPEELKLASLSVGKRLFPSVDFEGFKDADGLLIAEFCRLKKSLGTK